MFEQCRRDKDLVSTARAYIKKDDYTVGHLSNKEASRKQSLKYSTCLNEALKALNLLSNIFFALLQTYVRTKLFSLS